MELHHDTETAIVRVAGRRTHAIHHFLLQHEVHVFDASQVLEQVKQDRGGYVVGQVTDDAQFMLRIALQATVIDLQRILRVNDQPGVVLLLPPL